MVAHAEAAVATGVAVKMRTLLELPGRYSMLPVVATRVHIFWRI